MALSRAHFSVFCPDSGHYQAAGNLVSLAQRFAFAGKFQMPKAAAPQVPPFLDARFLDVFPTTLTIIPTYRCTAACEQCCFESSPKVRGRLSLQTIVERIEEARETFPALQIVVFSGGEVFLLKDDLYAAIEAAVSRGLRTRVVSNGFWGNAMARADSTARKLRRAGLNELNLSTGLDHQRFVSHESIVNAAVAAVSSGIITLVTVEQDSEASDCLARIAADEQIKRLLATPIFRIQSNSWMPFHASAVPRKAIPDRRSLLEGCAQVFNNLVVTPHDQLAGCCGLTFEHIPEMKLGRNGERSMAAMFEDQLSDFLKAWIHVDGPHRIMTRLFGEEAVTALSGVNHICQACVVLHQHPRVRDALRARYLEFAPEVLARLDAKLQLQARERLAKVSTDESGRTNKEVSS